MALAAIDLLERLAQMEGTTFDSWTEAKKQQRVAMINSALRWAWRTEQPKFAWPFTVGSATVTVTDGVISPSDLGDGTWCSLWSQDPRPATTNQFVGAYAIEARVSDEGVHPLQQLGSVFAFFRYAVPQLTYVEGGDYALPSDIPTALGDIVPLRALTTLLVSTKQWESVNALKATYGQPDEEKEGLRAAISNSSLVWGTNCLVLSPVSIATIPPTDRPTFANVRLVHSDVTYATSVAIDFDDDGFNTVELTGNITFTTSNLANARSKTVFIEADGSSRNLTFPGTWRWTTATPASIAAGKLGTLALVSRGTTDADVVAGFSVEP